MKVRKDNNFILNTLVRWRHNPTRMRNYRYTYNRQQLLATYLTHDYKLLPNAMAVIERFEKFRDFMIATGGFKGRTFDGRDFSIKYVKKDLPNQNRYGSPKQTFDKFLVKIWDKDGCVYEPDTDIADVMNESILSAINKYEKKFWSGYRKIHKQQRNIVTAKGTYDGGPFKVSINIFGTNINGIFDYDEETKSLYLPINIPNHIPQEQHHMYKVKMVSSKPILLEHLKTVVKQNYMRCCGYTISGDAKFCSRCGRAFDVEELVLDKIEERGLETILT